MGMCSSWVHKLFVHTVLGVSVQLRLAQLFSGSKPVYAWCFETILITNCYTFGSNEGITCVLCTLKINHKHFVSMETAPPIVNKE